MSDPRERAGGSASAREGRTDAASGKSVGLRSAHAHGADRSRAGWPALILVLLVAACRATVPAPWPLTDADQAPEPAISNFRVEPARLCYGDSFRYGFDYRDIPGGLVAVQEAALAARARRGAGRPTSLWTFIPDFDERVRYPAPTGSFRSGARYWRPADLAPKQGVDLEVTLILTLTYGEQVSAATTLRFDGDCPAPPSSTGAASPIGRLAFDTMTPSTAQFLTGEQGGGPVRIWGDLELPREGNARVPAVILMHGSEGVSRREARWAEELTAIGVASFIMDSLTGRDLAGATAELSTGALIVDVYRALEFLASYSRIDPTRIALMGFSRGGVVTLYAGLERFRRLYGPARVEFAAHVAFYPGCLLNYIDEERVTDRPIRIFHGTADDWTAIGPCRDYVERLRRAGKDAELTEYPGVRHAFDAPFLPPAIRMPNPLNTARCSLIEGHGGRIVNRDTGNPFAFTDACVSRGATLGYDQRAHHDAVRAVTAFLMETFKLER